MDESNDQPNPYRRQVSLVVLLLIISLALPFVDRKEEQDLGEMIMGSVLIGLLCITLCMIYKGYQGAVGIVIAIVCLMMLFFLTLLG